MSCENADRGRKPEKNKKYVKLKCRDCLVNRFYQQQLPACTPVVTVRNAYPFCLFVGIIFIALGAWFLSVSKNLFEVEIPYTHCESSTQGLCSELVKNPSRKPTDPPCQCRQSFTIDSNIAGPVYVYYGLTNFYQNHRRYVRSRDDNQLNGQDVTLSTSCDPFRVLNVDGKEVRFSD
ncbi:Cell cycle control protein 50A [Cichlidogyrus casuarinus]|uniref:Cell cycle control protein 50A n=1 Tax=Cichlidogyrus casuarinus TaxID=1844966 RepID=A0ABD2Q2Z6_9PLAT